MAAVLGAALLLSRSPQLVGFTPRHALTVDVAALTPPSEGAAAASAGGVQASPGRVEPSARRVRVLARTSNPAINEGLEPLRETQASQTQRSTTPQLIRAMANIPAKHAHLRTTLKPVRRPAIQQAPQPGQYEVEGTWMVLTDWSDDYAPPRTVLLTFNHRGAYAAVPVIGGWLIVRI